MRVVRPLHMKREITPLPLSLFNLLHLITRNQKGSSSSHDKSLFEVGEKGNHIRPSSVSSVPDLKSFDRKNNRDHPHPMTSPNEKENHVRPGNRSIYRKMDRQPAYPPPLLCVCVWGGGYKNDVTADRETDIFLHCCCMQES